MKEIRLPKLTIQNFKGIKELETEFGKRTTISGRNASGKTTILMLSPGASSEKTAAERAIPPMGVHGEDHRPSNGRAGAAD